ncbi:hypothetical protein [Arthrobacter sp. UYCo732]|uniref:hypothetical protein n=1 Tax=Arthrobacter sp. UYCo732 TaxID=3156336 RepID=UPI00339AC2CF
MGIRNDLNTSYDNDLMTGASQAVLFPSEGGSIALRIIGTERPTQPRCRGLQLGSQDLIRFASFASDRRFSVSAFMIADAGLSPLSGDEQARASAQMVDILTTYGGDELEAAMRDDFDGLYVVGVTVTAKSTGLPISVRRRGYVETSTVREAETLISAAWQELRLS